MDIFKQVGYSTMPLDIFKSRPGHGEDGVIDVEIGGVISDEQMDTQGERIIQKGIDFNTYLLGGTGRIKYEHNDMPMYNIGFPEEVKVEDGKTMFKGRIFSKPGMENYNVAKQVFDDLKLIAEYNKNNKDKPNFLKKGFGWSIEGGKLSKSGTDVDKSFVTHVVLTTKPVNPRTTVELYKSFTAASAGVNPYDLIGSEAARNESLEGDRFVEMTEKLSKATTEEQAVEIYKSFHYTESEAKYLAKMWKMDYDLNKSFDERITNQQENIKKALESCTAGITSFKGLDIDEMSKAFTTSTKPDGENNINAVNVISESAKLNIEMNKGLQAGLISIMETQENILKALNEDTDLKKSLEERIKNVSQEFTVIREKQSDMYKALQKSDKGISSEGLAFEDLSEPEGGNGGGAGNGGTPPPSDMTVEKVRDYYSENIKKAKEEDKIDLMKSFDDKLWDAQACGYNISKLPDSEQKAIRDYYNK